MLTVDTASFNPSQIRSAIDAKLTDDGITPKLIGYHFLLDVIAKTVFAETTKKAFADAVEKSCDAFDIEKTTALQAMRYATILAHEKNPKRPSTSKAYVMTIAEEIKSECNSDLNESDLNEKETEA